MHRIALASLLLLLFVGFGAMFFLWPKTALMTVSFMAFFIALRIAVTYREDTITWDFIKVSVYSLISAFSLRTAIVLFMS